MKLRVNFATLCDPNRVRNEILYLYVLKPSVAPTYLTYMTYMVLRKMVMGNRNGTMCILKISIVKLRENFGKLCDPKRVKVYTYMYSNQAKRLLFYTYMTYMFLEGIVNVSMRQFENLKILNRES